MTTEQVGKQLVTLCSQGKAMDAIQSLYSQDVVSVEATAMPDGTREMKGLAAVKGKSEWWIANHEVHSAKVEGPMVADSHFCVRFTYDITNKPSGNRMVMDELGVYHVKDGKIVREEFFYGA
jgi:ketosteroid isomerase-like protein